MHTRRTRHQIYLPDLSAMLDAMAAHPGSTNAAVITDALAAWFYRRAGHELNQRFTTRLDRLSRRSAVYPASAYPHRVPAGFRRRSDRLGRLGYYNRMKLVGRMLARTVPRQGLLTSHAQKWRRVNEGIRHA